MEESVTLKLGRYEALRDKARRVDVLEKENAELRERLDNTMTIRSRTGGVTVGPKGIKSFVDSDKYINAVDGAELRNNTNKVTLDATEVYQVIRQAFDKVKEEENVKSVKDLLAENEMLHKMGVFKHYATGGVTTKEEVTKLKRSKKNK